MNCFPYRILQFCRKFHFPTEPFHLLQFPSLQSIHQFFVCIRPQQQRNFYFHHLKTSFPRKLARSRNFYFSRIPFEFRARNFVYGGFQFRAGGGKVVPIEFRNFPFQFGNFFALPFSGFAVSLKRFLQGQELRIPICP